MRRRLGLMTVPLLVALSSCDAIDIVGKLRPGPSGLEPGACGLPSPAFCEQFETIYPGGRGGDLDEALWSVSRWGHQVEYFWERKPANTYADHLFPATFCGNAFSGILPDGDFKICSGRGVDGQTSRQLNEVFDDQGAFGVNALRIRQPFDFTNRTGTVVWDVDAKVNPLNLGHGWFIEVWITQDPMPMPYQDGDGIGSYPQRGVGFSFAFGADCPESATAWQSALEDVYVTDNYQLLQQTPYWMLDQATARCFQVADAHLNHFELHLSKDNAELWASDFDAPSTLQRRVSVPNLGLTFTRGYVHFEHAAFDAAKDGNVTPAQTFRWDNIGFDGPALGLPRVYEAPDPLTIGQQGALRVGWDLNAGQTQSFAFSNVDLTRAASASFNFVLFAQPGQTLEIRVNAGAPTNFVYPATGTMLGGVHGFSIPLPLDQLVAGDNRVDVRVPQPVNAEGIGSVDLTIDLEP